MRARRSVFLFLAVLSIACSREAVERAASADPAVDAAAVKQSIEAANARIMTALKAGDADGMAREFAPDGMAMDPNMPAAVGPVAIAEGAKASFATMKMSDIALNTTDVVVNGDLAVETGTYSLTMEIPNVPPISDKGKFVTVWKRQADGSWKVFRNIYNTDQPAPGQK